MCKSWPLKFLRGGGGSGPKIFNTDFKIWVDPMTHTATQWANFLVGFKVPTPFSVSVAATLIFPPK